jgi:hypothetical protein
MKRTLTGYMWTRIAVLAILLLLNGCTHKPISITHEIHGESPVISTPRAEEPRYPIFTTFFYMVLTGAVIALVVDAIKLETGWYFFKKQHALLDT